MTKYLRFVERLEGRVLWRHTLYPLRRRSLTSRLHPAEAAQEPRLLPVTAATGGGGGASAVRVGRDVTSDAGQRHIGRRLRRRVRLHIRKALLTMTR